MWAYFLSLLIGVWLMFAPEALGYGDPARANSYILGPLVICFSYLAMWEITRAARWMNVPLGLWLLLAPWVLGYGNVPLLNASAAGGALVAFAFVNAGQKEPYGGGWSSLWKNPAGLGSDMGHRRKGLSPNCLRGP